MDDRRRTNLLLSAAVAGPLAVCAVLATFRGAFDNTNAALVLVLVVVAVAAAGHRPSGILAALSSAAWFDFFLTEPYCRFTIDDREDVETAVLLVLVGIAVAEIAAWGRRQQARSSTREGYLEGLVSSARMAADGDTTQDALATFVSDQLVAVLGLDRCRFERGAPQAHPRLNADGTVTRDSHVIDVDRTGLPTIDVIELPVEHQGVVVGRFVMTCATRVSRPTLEQRLVAVTLADQAAAALASAP
jgi:K+-sensing histidine kinase KdpD